MCGAVSKWLVVESCFNRSLRPWLSVETVICSEGRHIDIGDSGLEPTYGQLGTQGSKADLLALLVVLGNQQ